ncbi:unnamed protein product [Umbelopsis sp. WA50703]
MSIILLVTWLASTSSQGNWYTCHESSKPEVAKAPEESILRQTKVDGFKYYDMNQLNASAQDTYYNQHVLILTPFKEAARHIERYFQNVNSLTYPHHLISLGFLVSDSQDGTIEKLQQHAHDVNNKQEPWQRFHKISIFQKDFDFVLSESDRHDYEVQIKRREVMSKSRNYLLASALTEDIAWVLWLDGDVIEYPATLIEDLTSMDKDVIVPNCWWHSYNEEGGYDKNNWQETNESWSLQSTLKPNDVLVEGYEDYIKTHRKLLIDSRFPDGITDLMYTIPLDGVGGTCTLVKAQVHRDGAIFPPFPFQHQVETEGLAKMAKALGYEVWGLPNYLIFHII